MLECTRAAELRTASGLAEGARVVQLQQAWEQLVIHRLCAIVGWRLDARAYVQTAVVRWAIKRAPGGIVSVAGLHVALLCLGQEVGQCRPLVEQ